MPLPRFCPPEQTAATAFEAAALLLVDPAGMGGVRLSAYPGPVRDAWLALLKRLAPPGMALARLPAHASEDRLVGGLDLAATLAQSKPVMQSGLLAQADGGVVICAMAERLPRPSAAALCAALDQGELVLEREGLSARLPARVAAVALDEAEPDEPGICAALADRLGLWVDLRSLPWQHTLEGDDTLRAQVQAARARRSQVSVAAQWVQALCEASLALGVHGSRACWQALRCAQAAAALRGHDEVQADDVTIAAQLVLAPRATTAPQFAADEVAQMPPPSSPDGADDPAAPPHTASPPAPPDAGDPPPDALQSAGALDAVVVAAALAFLPPGVLTPGAPGERMRGGSSAAGRVGTAAASRRLGRSVGARRARPEGGARVHVLATLREAAPWQRLRRAACNGEGAVPAPALQVRPQDLHVHRREHRRTTTTIFALDASGSAALHRLAEAKGAIELLLAQCYVRRDEVAVIAFRASAAQLVLAPTRSLVRARRGLSGLPGGGGTPLAAGIDAAAALAQRVQRGGGTALVVLLTDGRANVARDGQGGRERAREDALAAARGLARLGVRVLLIDTSVRPDPAANALAQAARARYLPLPLARASQMAQALRLQAGPRAPVGVGP